MDGNLAQALWMSVAAGLSQAAVRVTFRAAVSSGGSTGGGSTFKISHMIVGNHALSFLLGFGLSCLSLSLSVH